MRKVAIIEKGLRLRCFVGNLVKNFRKTIFLQTFKRLLLRLLEIFLISSTEQIPKGVSRALSEIYDEAFLQKFSQKSYIIDV